MSKSKFISIIGILILLVLMPNICAGWGEEVFKDYYEDLPSYDYSYGSWWSSSQGENNWWLDDAKGEFSQFLQRALSVSGYDALSSSVCEVFVDKTNTPAGVMIGEGGYPMGHIEGSYYEYYVFNETSPYNYPDDIGSGEGYSESQDPGANYETKRIYTISFEVDPEDIAGSDTIDLIFTVGGDPLDLDLTNDTITNIHEIDVDGSAFSMKGENLMIKNGTFENGQWKIQTGNDQWTIIDDSTEVCIRFSPKDELNPEFASYLEDGEKKCNTFKAEIGTGNLFNGLPNPWTT